MKKQYILKKMVGLLLCLGMVTIVLNSCGDENFWGIQSNQYKIF